MKRPWKRKKPAPVLIEASVKMTGAGGLRDGR